MIAKGSRICDHINQMLTVTYSFYLTIFSVKLKIDNNKRLITLSVIHNIAELKNGSAAANPQFLKLRRIFRDEIIGKSDLSCRLCQTVFKEVSISLTILIWQQLH